MIKGWFVKYDKGRSRVHNMYESSPLQRPLTEEEYFKIQKLFWEIHHPVYFSGDGRLKTGDLIFLPCLPN